MFRSQKALVIFFLRWWVDLELSKLLENFAELVPEPCKTHFFTFLPLCKVLLLQNSLRDCVGSKSVFVRANVHSIELDLSLE